jgi:DNA polymerase V
MTLPGRGQSKNDSEVSVKSVAIQCAIDGEFRIKRYRTHPQPHLINLESGRREALPVDDDGYGSAPAIFGVITYIINDASNAEFDDCPVM